MKTLTQTNAYYEDVSNEDVICTGWMGACVTIVLCSTASTRAQHCSGGVEAYVRGIGNVSSPQCVLFVGPEITDYVTEKIQEFLNDEGLTGVPYGISDLSHGYVDLRALRNARTPDTIVGCVTSVAPTPPRQRRQRRCVIL